MSDLTAEQAKPSTSSRWHSVQELLSSMRFAIALLTVICIASVIGTVLKQNEPVNNYINQFGPFWFQVFDALHLYNVYSAWWFLLILAFLVTSTSLCIARNTPKILKDVREFKESIREQSLQSFPHKAEAVLATGGQAVAHKLQNTLVASGWKVKVQPRSTPQGPGWMLAAKKGSANKLGYIAAHTAIVLICLGGLFDGELVVRAQMWLSGKTPFAGVGMISDVPEQHRLSERTPAFRGQLQVNEGSLAGIAVLNQPDGVLLQPLPFDVELKKFQVDYYSTGMPKLFASDIVIHDRATGQQHPARVKVNHPVQYQGYEIFQSSFQDGGSHLTLRVQPLGGSAQPLPLKADVGTTVPVTVGGKPMTLELQDLRVINVENFSGQPARAADADTASVRTAIENHLGAGNKTSNPRQLRNVGPSITYKLRDEAGQAHEFHNYMLPIEVDGQRVVVLGMRDTPSEPFRYLRLPVDDNDSIDGFVRLRSALQDPAQRREAVRRYARQATDTHRADLTEALTLSAQRAIDLFAGAEPAQGAQVATPGGTPAAAGLQALSASIEAHVPEAERERAADVLLRIVNGTLFELYQISRERAALPPAPRTPATGAFMTQAVLSLSDAFFYPEPLTVLLTDFQQVQASVFQVSRAPGKKIVYLGCFFLILGVFAMLYVREWRIWVWLAPREDGAWNLRLAASSNRQMLDNEHEFNQIKQRLLATSSTPSSHEPHPQP